MATARPLRPHQVKALDLIRHAVMERARRPLLQLPTGGGKTRLAAEIVERARAKGNRVVFVVPALSLIDQTVKAFAAEGIPLHEIGVIQADHSMTSPQRPIQVASVQTLERRPLPQADVVIIDECFAAGTPIDTPTGPVPIERIRPGDVVFNATGVGTVEGVVCQQKETIRLELCDGTSITCTDDHPIFTDQGWVPAGNLEVGSRLFSRSDLCRLWLRDETLDRQDGEGSSGGELSRAAVLHGLLREEARESDVLSGGPRQDVGDAPADWAPAQDEGRKRGAHGASGAEIARRLGGGLGAGAFGEDRIRAGGFEVRDGLQDRYRTSGDDDCDRSGRQQSPLARRTPSGSTEGGVFGSVGVVTVSRGERGGLETVYNLRVSGHPSYFAGGILVHNCHRWFRFYGRWMATADWEKVPFIGLSATPWTKGLGKHFDRLLIAATMQELIDAGFLSPFRVFAPSHPDLGGVRTVAGDYHEGDLSAAMDKPDLVADVVRTWLQRGEGRPTLCFGVDRAHAKSLQRQFEASGVRAGYVDAHTDADEREQVRKAFHVGELQVVCNVGVLTTGVDWDVRCIVLARPTKSEMLYVQIVGRGLRTADGKPDCLVLDHSDTTLRLGFVTDIHHDALDGGEMTKAQTRERPVALPKECPKCSFLKPAKIHICPACSFAPERQSAVTCDAGGELREIARAGKSRKATPEQKAEWFAMLLACAHERKKPNPENWAAGMFNARFGGWPARKFGVAPKPPTPEVRGYVKSRLIAYAMGQKKGARHAA